MTSIQTATQLGQQMKPQESDLYGKQIPLGSFVIASINDWLLVGVVIKNKQDGIVSLTYPNWTGTRWVTIQRPTIQVIVIPLDHFLQVHLVGTKDQVTSQRNMLRRKYEEFNGPTNWPNP